VAGETLGALLKYREDVDQVRRTALPALLAPTTGPG
jgi:hypothetical protein